MSTLELRDQLKQCRRDVDLANFADRLQLNADFKDVIHQNLFIDKSNALVSQMSLFSKESVEYQQILRELDAISYLRNYFIQLEVTGADAQVSIQDAQNTLNSREE